MFFGGAADGAAEAVDKNGEPDGLSTPQATVGMPVNLDDDGAGRRGGSGDLENLDDADGSNPGAGSSDNRCTVKFLLSNAAAGSVIGKSGATITEFQQQSNARIQLSRAREFFPGTSDRILVLTGSVNSILTALHLILSKLLAEESSTGAAGVTSMPVKLVVPNAVCGGIIGKGGATIRSFVDDSGAQIKISSQDATPVGVTDRIITVTGTLEQQLRAVALTVTKMAEDPSYPMYAAMPINYSAVGPASPYGGGGALSPLVGGGASAALLRGAATAAASPATAAAAAAALAPLAGASPAASSLSPAGAASTSITVAVPDEHIGAVVGRGGRTITELQQVANVRIKISDRNDYVPGTRNRKVTITGTPEAVQIAHFLVAQKVSLSVAEFAAKPQ
ncbi:hypothetical protein PPROV_000079400 [Pycnococcus provasolii]|uniref:K Homology domain-containing protein n=1 Tax=Pycnococcus provasolii TaxID=41880 RepID=A0A830H605_9CHLO|nr:hypothetical protein PPROV_000079400 [Pycnococcus provasolii]